MQTLIALAFGALAAVAAPLIAAAPASADGVACSNACVMDDNGYQDMEPYSYDPSWPSPDHIGVLVGTSD